MVSALIAKIGLHDELALRPAPYHPDSPLIELSLNLGLGVVSGLVAVMFEFFSRKVMYVLVCVQTVAACGLVDTALFVG